MRAFILIIAIIADVENTYDICYTDALTVKWLRKTMEIILKERKRKRKREREGGEERGAKGNRETQLTLNHPYCNCAMGNCLDR